MAGSGLYEVIIPSDRWSIRAVSPVDIRDGVVPSEHGHPVLVHPGWGKGPESHTELLHDLAEEGFLGIGVDTRYAYSDQQISGTIKPRILTQSYSAGSTNPYFEEADQGANRYRLRRPTSLLYLCDRLGILHRSFVGHSEGGRIVTLAALGKPKLTDGVVIVNGVGTGDSSGGLSRMAQSNANRLKDIIKDPSHLREVLASALGSVAYAATHLRRTVREKQVIQNTDLWPALAQLSKARVPVKVLHARGDELVSFEDSARQASFMPSIEFTPTEGNHSNIYELAIRELIVNSLQIMS